MSARFLTLAALLLIGGGTIWWVQRTAAPQAPPGVHERAGSDSQSDHDASPAPVPSQAASSQALPKPSEALAQTPATGPRRESSRRNQEAIEHLEAGELEEAIKLFETNVEEHPDEPVFQQNLAEALLRLALREYDHEPEVAFAHLERAIELAPARQELLPLRDRWRTAVQAQAGFAEDQSTHFVLQYDGDRSDLLTLGYREVLDDLENAYQDYGEFFDVFPVEAGRPKFRAVLYDREAFDQVTGIGEWAGGAYDGTIRVPVRHFQRDRNRIRQTLRHELVHAFVDEVGGRGVPGWLNEGLAQYLSETNLSQRTRALDRARSQLVGKDLFSPTQLQGSLAQISEPEQVAKAYDQALAFTHWIAVHYGERTLVRMTQASQQGSDAAATFQRWIGVGLETAHQDFVDSL